MWEYESEELGLSYDDSESGVITEIDEFKIILNDIEAKLNENEFDLLNGDYIIKEHCKELQIELQAVKEAKIQQINEISDYLRNQIDNFEKDAFSGYLKLNKKEYAKKLNDIKEHLKDWKLLLTEQKINEMKKQLDELKDAQSKLIIDKEKLRFLNFNGKLYNYGQKIKSCRL